MADKLNEAGTDFGEIVISATVNNFNLAQLVMSYRELRTRYALIITTFHFYDQQLINNEP